MIIPTLKSIDIRGIRPFNIHGGKIKFSKGVSYFCRENGRGKTTLIDLIRLNLFRLNYIDEYKSIQEKIYPDPTGTKTIEHFVKCDWEFGSENVSIKQELNRGGITSFIGGKWEKESNFNETIKDIFHANLSVSQMIDLYKILVFIEETSTEKNLIQDWEKFTEEALPELVLEADKFSFLQDYRHFLRKEKDLNRSFTHLNADFKQSKELLKEFIEEVKVIPAIKESIENVNSELLLENEKLSEFKSKKKNLSEKFFSLQKYQQNISVKRKILEDIQEKKQSIANLKRLEIAFGEKTTPKSPKITLKDDFREFHGKDTCPVCQTGKIVSKWETTIIHSQRCPLCKIPLDRVSDSIKTELYLSAKSEKDIKGRKISEIKSSIFEEDERLAHLQSELEIINSSLSGVEFVLTSLESTIESEILYIASKMKELDANIVGVYTEIQKLTTHLAQEENSLKYLNQVREKIRKKEALRKNKEDLDTARKDLEYVRGFLLSNSEKYQKTVSSLNSLKGRITDYIKSESQHLLNFEFQFDANSMNLILPGGEVRYFYSCSGGEKHFADFCLRVLVWKFLISEGKQKKGLLILDNPGAIISDSYLALFKQIIAQTQDDIQFIITSNGTDLYDEEFYLIQELKTKVRTLMDFMA